MRLIVGAPVAHRAWALPHWFQCLAAQTRRPDGIVFVHSGRVGDATWTAIQREADAWGFATVAIHHDPAIAHARHDNERFATLARLRNDLLAMARDSLHADLFLSLDTDVMLEDPRTILHLEELVLAGECDLAAPTAFLHPLAPRRWQPGNPPAWAYNFGFLADPFEPPGPRRAWKRPDVDLIPWGELIAATVPMAAWLGNRRTLDCRYDWHESGEDLGYAQSLEAAGLRTLVDTSLYAYHAWDQEHLAQALRVPA